MKTTIATIAILIGATLSGLAGDHYVEGYYRSNGTYVQPHYQTNPNGTVYDNYSTQGNYNPYTGEVGTRSPYYIRPRGEAYLNQYGELRFAP